MEVAVVWALLLFLVKAIFTITQLEEHIRHRNSFIEELIEENAELKTKIKEILTDAFIQATKDDP